MARHIVKCFVCGKSFDLNSEQGVRHGTRRYSHATCEPENTNFVPMEQISKEEKELRELKDYINNKYKDKANWQLINKQIKSFVAEYHYTYSGILKTLIYFYDVKGNSVENSNGGIGIVQFQYQECYQYYYQLYLAQEKNKNNKIDYQFKEIVIQKPKQRFFNKLFNLD